jgi:hypothetical protein
MHIDDQSLSAIHLASAGALGSGRRSASSARHDPGDARRDALALRALLAAARVGVAR